MTVSVWKQALYRKTVWFSLIVMLGLMVVSATATWIAPHDPYRWTLNNDNRPPAWVRNTSEPGSPAYPLGTDRYGRDVLSRLIYGTRTAFLLALAAVPLAALLGTVAGLVAGYAGGRVDTAFLYLSDMLQSLPGIMFLVIIVLIFRSRLAPSWANGLLTLVVGFAAVSWVGLARLVRINVLQLKSQLFVEAAISTGASRRRIVTRHLLPNVLHVIVIWMINNVPAVILLEALLGYIGVGVTGATDGSEFTAASWGGLFYSGRSALRRNPLMLLTPSLCLLLISMSFILLGDFVESATRRERE